MASKTSTNPLSSAIVTAASPASFTASFTAYFSALARRLSFVAPDAAERPAHLGWRSEAFAEDLLGDLPSSPAAHPSPWSQGALQCALPLAFALAGGVMAFWTTGV